MIADVDVIEVAVTAEITGGAAVVANVKFAEVAEALDPLTDVTA
jgi:hypothetical protein